MKKVPMDGTHIAFSLLFVLSLVAFFVFLNVEGTHFYPVLHMLFIAGSAFVAFNVAYVIRQAYSLNKDHTMFFLFLGLFVFATFWLLNALSTPGSLGSESSVFLWTKTLSGFLSSLLLVIGLIPFSKKDQKSLHDMHDQIFFIVIVLLFMFTLLLTTNPLVLMLIPSSGHLFSVLNWIAFVLLLVVGIGYKIYHDHFRGLHYDHISHTLLFLALAQVCLIFGEPWTALWWLYNILLFVSFILLLVVFLREVEQQKYFDDQISGWSASLNDKS